MRLIAILFIINVIFFISEILLMNGGFINYLSLNINDIHIHQFITYQFIHNSGAHLSNNLIGLIMFGEHVENYFGKKKFLISYLFCGVIGAIFQLIYGFDTILMGASGAIFGLMSLYLMIRKKIKKENKKLHILLTILAVFFIVSELYQIILGVKSNIGHWTHIGGVVGGFLIYLFYERKTFLKQLIYLQQ